MRKRARLVNAWTTQHAGWVLIILALVSVFQLAYFSWNNRQTTNCQTQYNLALADALQTRAQYSEQDRHNDVMFVRRIAQADTQSESRSALEDYLRVQAEIDEARKGEPIPKLPPGRCS